MPHILVAGKLHPAGLALLDAAQGVTYDHIEEVSEASYQSFLGQADAMVIRTQPLSASSVAKGQRLQIVSRHGVGYDAVDVAALNSRKIPLCIVGDVNSVSVAEHSMMFILACAKKLIQADVAVRDERWEWRNKLQAGEVSARRLFIIGYGRIGRHLARMASGFNMEIRAYDPYLKETGWPEGDVSCERDLATGLAWADFVSVHAPKGDVPLLGVKELSSVKPGIVVVNTARGGVVDEQALQEALRDGRVSMAGLDVFDEEPPTRLNRFLGMDQVVLTPHIAGLTIEAAERMAVASVQNILDFFAGRLAPELIVNKEFI